MDVLITDKKRQNKSTCHFVSHFCVCWSNKNWSELENNEKTARESKSAIPQNKNTFSAKNADCMWFVPMENPIWKRLDIWDRSFPNLNYIRNPNFPALMSKSKKKHKRSNTTMIMKVQQNNAEELQRYSINTFGLQPKWYRATLSTQWLVAHNIFVAFSI